MTSQQSEPQQQPGAQPVVLVVNQPMMMNHRQQYFCTRQPYLLRGAQFSNGCRCYLPHMILLCTLGGFVVFIGISVVTVGIPIGILLLAVGGMLLGLGIYLIRIAKRQYNSLPADHPDRTKYVARFLAPGLGHGPTVYAMPPMQNQVMSYPPNTGGQVYLMPLPSGSYPPNLSGLDGGQVQFVVASPGAGTPLQSTYVPENDPPPAYSDVVRNT